MKGLISFGKLKISPGLEFLKRFSKLFGYVLGEFV